MRRLFIMRKDLHMSPGKLAAQVSHCAEVYWLHLLQNSDIEELDDSLYGGMVYVQKDVWEKYIKGAIVKTICEAKNKNQLMKAKVMAEELNLIQGIDFGFIKDACLTELEPEEEDGTCITGIWFAPLDDEVAHAISKKYHLYME